jgi:hypothetical protein
MNNELVDFGMRFWNQFLRFIGRRYGTKVVHEKLPPSLSKKIVYVVADDECMWHMALICPCDCGETLYMNLLKDERPCWEITQHIDCTFSIYPSIRRLVGCKSHFWIKHGKLIWSE